MKNVRKGKIMVENLKRRRRKSTHIKHQTHKEALELKTVWRQDIHQKKEEREEKSETNPKHT
jgi:hypothetical protein